VVSAILGATPNPALEETAMHPAIGYQLATAQIAAHRCQADRDQVGRAAKRARRSRQLHPSHPARRWNAAALTHRALIVLGTRNP
jgi:hypothetical protein